MFSARLSMSFSILFLTGTTCFAAGFCDDLKAVVASSAKFSVLKGKVIDAETWQAKQSISGFQKCEISCPGRCSRVLDWLFPAPHLFFTCSTPELVSLEAVVNKYNQVVTDVKSCLPAPLWKHSQPPRPDSIKAATPHNVDYFDYQIEHSFDHGTDRSGGTIGIWPSGDEGRSIYLRIYERF
jgi:hypothetical protein